MPEGSKDHPYERPLRTTADVKNELENIYGHKVGELEPSVIKIQRWTRSYMVRKRLQKLAKIYRESEVTKIPRLRQRKAREIIETEQSYLESLDNLFKRYYQPMLELTTVRARMFSSPILSGKEHSQIFMNIMLILEFHKSFFVELCMEFNNWPASPVRLGKKFVQFSPFLKLYTEYTNCYQKSSNTLQTCLKRNGFAQWMEEHRKENMDCLPLESMLIMPIQRIPRYRMLLEEVIKCTPEEHVDYKDLCAALELIKEIASFINERKRESENMGKVADIQQSIRGLNMNIVHPLRRLLKRGELTRINPNTNAQENRYFYLFSDMMLATTNAGDDGIRIYDGYILIRGAKLFAMKRNNEFGVQYQNGKKFFYRAKNEEKKNKWVSFFNKGIAELDAIPPDQASDFLLESEHFGGGSAIKAGPMKTYETRLLINKLHTRWFILRDGILYKKKNAQDKQYRSVVQLENYKIRENSTENESSCAFDLVHPTDTQTFVLQTVPEKLAWIQALRETILAAEQPITDLCVIHTDKGDKIPLGYNPILQTYYGNTGNVNAEGGGREIIICYQRGGVDENDQPKPPITSIGIAFTDSGSLLKRRAPEVVPSGWKKIEKTFYGRDLADLNRGKGGREIYLYYKNEPNRPAITRITLHWRGTGEMVPPTFTLLEYTVSGGFVANLNTGAGNPEIFFCYKKESDEEKFLHAELGWDPRSGFSHQKMPIAWQHFFSEIPLYKGDIEGDNDLVRFIAEETIKKYQELVSQTKKRNLLSCYACYRTFEYPDDTNMVLCPFCQTINQCLLVPSVVPENKPKRQLAASCDPRIGQEVKQPSVMEKSSSFAIGTGLNQPSYVPAYLIPSNSAVPQAYQNYTPPQDLLPSYARYQTTQDTSNVQPVTTSYAPAYLTGVSTSTPQVIPPMGDPLQQIPLGTVPRQEIEVTAQNETTVDFSSLSDKEYAELLQYVRSRYALRKDGLDDFQFVSE